MGWQLDVFLNSCSPMSHYYYSEHQQTEISTVVHNTIWKKKKNHTHSQRAILSAIPPSLLSSTAMFSQAVLLTWVLFIHHRNYNSMKIPLNFYHRCTIYPLGKTCFSLLILSLLCQQPLSTRVISFIGSCVNPFTELCLINKSTTPLPQNPKQEAKLN